MVISLILVKFNQFLIKFSKFGEISPNFGHIYQNLAKFDHVIINLFKCSKRRVKFTKFDKLVKSEQNCENVTKILENLPKA